MNGMPLTKDALHFRAYINSLLHDKPEPLRHLLVSDIQNEVNDQYTKSSAYWVMHHYFDNGGNIYEIADFVSKHPALTFLETDAPKINPKQFAQLKQGELPHVYSMRSTYVLLAYLEVLEQHDLASIATLGTLANQYAFAAYHTHIAPNDFPTNFDHAGFSHMAIERSEKYEKKLRQIVADILDNKISVPEAPPRDILVGLNQYAAALRYLKGVGIEIDSLKSPNEIFVFTMRYAACFVPEIHLFTSLLNATTLAVTPDEDTANNMRIALEPFYSFNLPKYKRRKGNIVDRIIDLKDVDDHSMNIYGKRNIRNLAKFVPEWRQWLINNGWKESDLS